MQPVSSVRDEVYDAIGSLVRRLVLSVNLFWSP